MISSCISEISNKYEQLGNKLTSKMDALESTSQNLTRKFEALKKERVEKDIMALRTQPETNVQTNAQTIAYNESRPELEPMDQNKKKKTASFN
jgi:transposase